jgi:hypothetical protein
VLLFCCMPMVRLQALLRSSSKAASHKEFPWEASVARWLFPCHYMHRSGCLVGLVVHRTRLRGSRLANLLIDSRDRPNDRDSGVARIAEPDSRWRVVKSPCRKSLGHHRMNDRQGYLRQSAPKRMTEPVISLSGADCGCHCGKGGAHRFQRQCSRESAPCIVRIPDGQISKRPTTSSGRVFRSWKLAPVGRDMSLREG